MGIVRFLTGLRYYDLSRVTRLSLRFHLDQCAGIDNIIPWPRYTVN